MEKTLFSILLLSILNGCATFNQVMVNRSGSAEMCQVHGQGAIQIGAAMQVQNACVQGLISAGYLPIQQAGTIGILLNESSPPIVMKVLNQSKLNKLGIKPGDTLLSVDNYRPTSRKEAEELFFGPTNETIELSFGTDSGIKTFSMNREPQTTLAPNSKGDFAVSCSDRELPDCSEIHDRGKRYLCNKNRREAIKLLSFCD